LHQQAVRLLAPNTLGHRADAQRQRSQSALQRAFRQAQQARLGRSRDAAHTARIGALALQGHGVEFGTPATYLESAAVMCPDAAEVAAEPSGTALLGTTVWWGRAVGVVDRACRCSCGWATPRRWAARRAAP
jgi:hypothetical protein